MDEGNFSIEIDELNLVLRKPIENNVNFKVEVEISNGFNAFFWSTNKETKYSSDKFLPSKQDDQTLESEGLVKYLHGFNGLLLQSGFVELNKEVVNTLANATINVKIISLNEAAAAPPAKAAKGAPPPVVTPAEEIYLNIELSFATLLSQKGNLVLCDQTLTSYLDFNDEVGVNIRINHPNVDLSQSSFNLKLFADNNLAEYVLGSRFIYWRFAEISGPPHTWSLHAPDVLDPKAKVQPTAADLRTKYLDNIQKLIDTQEKVAKYTLIIGGSDNSTASTEEDTDEDSTSKKILKYFPSLELSQGKISFDRTIAQEIPPEEDIRVRGDLWKIEWGRSQGVFIHRSDLRNLVNILSNDPHNCYIPLTMKKAPLPETLAVEGGEVFATAIVDLSYLSNQGEKILTIPVRLEGDLMDTSLPQFNVVFTSTSPLISKSPLTEIAKASINTTSKPKPIVSSNSSNKNVIQELRDEISTTIERIGQEFVSLYPQSLVEYQSELSANNNNGSTMTLNSLQDDQRTKFLQYIITNGIFFELQEKLRPKVMNIIQEVYGSKGRALGLSEIMKSVDTHSQIPFDYNNPENIQQILGELYKFIFQETNIVINSMFTNTILHKSIHEIENPSYIDDTKETDLQILQRLFRQSYDYIADNKFQVANDFFLERLNMIDTIPSLNQNQSIIHQIYLEYTEFLLKYSSNLIIDSNSSESKDQRDNLLRKAREACTIAYDKNSTNDLQTNVLYISILIECQQYEMSEEIIHEVLSKLLYTYQLTNFNEDFNGYESDKLVSIDPKIYLILGCLCYMQKKPLQCRKSLLLATRCFEESMSTSKLNAFGKPRRTLVMLLSELTLYFVKFGFFTLASAASFLALDCESAVYVKAQAKNKPNLIPPHIKYLLKRAKVEAEWGNFNEPTTDVMSNIDEATLCFNIAETTEDKIFSKITEGRAWRRSKIHSEQAVEAFSSAIQLSMSEVPLDSMQSNPYVSLDIFIFVGRYLLLTGQLPEAINVLLYGSQVYSSAILCCLLGICYLRLEKLDDAEDIFMEGNLLDNKNTEIWTYLCILCLQRGTVAKIVEAEECLFQALRLNQQDPILLRELAMAFMSIDKLQTAEDLIRRAIASEIAFGPSNRRQANPYTRKLLADILAGQNMAAKAIEEYKSILSDEELDSETKLAIAEKCYSMMISLGREEELAALSNIITNLKNSNNLAQ